MTPTERKTRLKQKVALLRERADWIENIPAEQFNLNHWWAPNGMAFDDDRNRMYRIAPLDCGCAVGHMLKAGFIPGLALEGRSLIDNWCVPPSTASRERVFVIVGDAFGITWELAKFLFDPCAYGENKSRAAVARRMRFIADELLLEEQ